MQHTRHLRQSEQDHLKSKIRRTCENYYRINIPYHYEEIIKTLSTKKDIIILRRDKGRGVVVLNRTSYIKNAPTYLLVTNLKFLKIILQKHLKVKSKKC